MIGLSPLPTGHPKTFQRQPVRPSIPCYRDFSLPMGRSPGFASAAPDSFALLRLAFAAAAPLNGLALPGTATRRLIMQKARRHHTYVAPTACRRAVSGSVSPSCQECFSPFPHGTGSLSVFREYLALPDGAGGFRGGFTGPPLLRVSGQHTFLGLRGSHPLRRRFPAASALARYA